MIRINLIAGERKVLVARTAAPSNTTAPPLVIGAGLILLLLVAGLGWRYWLVNAESARLDADIAVAQQEADALQTVLAQVAQFEQRKGQLQQRVTLIEELRSNQTGPVHMLDQISRALPPMVWLTELKQTAVLNEVVIGGRCTTLTGLSDFVTSLEASGYFRKSIEIVSSTTEPLPTPPGELVKFEIKAIFQQPGAPVAGDAIDAASAGSSAAGAP